MKAIVRRRARIARVRRIEHAHAAAIAVAAETRVVTLEQQSSHLGRLAVDLAPTSGLMTGATLSNAAELADRLRRAQHSLANTISGARAAAFEQSLARIEARIRQESADRLETRAHEKLAEDLERRFAHAARAHRRGPAEEGRS